MIGSNHITIFQVGNGAPQFQDAVEGTCRGVELFHGCLEQALGLLFCLTEVSYLSGCHFGVTGQNN
jgi:hypothetical protein